MAKENANTTGVENPFLSTTAMDSMKEFWGFQMRMGQAWAEQAMKMSQTWTDFAYTQAQDAAKLTHDCVKHSMGVAEETRKGWTHFAERATKMN